MMALPMLPAPMNPSLIPANCPWPASVIDIDLIRRHIFIYSIVAHLPWRLHEKSGGGKRLALHPQPVAQAFQPVPAQAKACGYQ